MIETLQILQLVVGGLMIIAGGVWLYFNFRWNNASATGSSEKIPADKQAILSRTMRLIVIFLVIPNIILIVTIRVLQ